MSEETAMEITFPVQAVPKTARTGVYQHFYPNGSEFSGLS